MIKFNISNKGKAWKLESESNPLNGKILGDKIDGKLLKVELAGYELEITGGSDSSGFALSKDIDGIGLKKVLLSEGWGMHKRPRKEGKRRVPQSKGLRLKKTYRGKVISETASLINLKVVKEGGKKLEEVFPEQSGKVEEKKANEGSEGAGSGEQVKQEEKKEGAPKEEKPAEVPAQ